MTGIKRILLLRQWTEKACNKQYKKKIQYDLDKFARPSVSITFLYLLKKFIFDIT